MPDEGRTVTPSKSELVSSPIGVSDELPLDTRAQDICEVDNGSTQDSFPRLSRWQGNLLICTISSAGFLTVLNVQSIVIMLPSISADIGIPHSRRQMVISLYSISLGSTILTWGRIADIYGYRRIFLLGATIFTICNLCLPFSTFEIPFYVLRIIQGLSGAAMLPSGFGIATSTFPPGSDRNRAFVAISAVASLGSVLGNIFGGVVGGLLTWRWAFWIPAVLSAITTAAAAAITSINMLTVKPSSSSQSQASRTVDWLGGSLISSGLLLLLIALTEANVLGWKTVWVAPLIVAAISILLVFVFHQHRLEKSSTQQPLVRMSMFKKGRFSALFAMVACFFGSFNGYAVFATYLYQDYLGLDGLETTLRFLPAGISGILVSFVVSPSLSFIPGSYLLFFALLCGLIPPFLLAIPCLSPHAIYWTYQFPAMCLCCSVEIIWPVISIYMAGELPSKDQALGSGLVQTANNIGRAFGLAIATMVQARTQGKILDQSISISLLQGIRAGQWVNFSLMAVSMTIALGFFRNLGRR